MCFNASITLPQLLSFSPLLETAPMNVFVPKLVGLGLEQLIELKRFGFASLKPLPFQVDLLKD